jgi:hypothetical protein
VKGRFTPDPAPEKNLHDSKIPERNVNVAEEKSTETMYYRPQ